jgi:hypothetical protein
LLVLVKNIHVEKSWFSQQIAPIIVYSIYLVKNNIFFIYFFHVLNLTHNSCMDIKFLLKNDSLGLLFWTESKTNPASSLAQFSPEPRILAQRLHISLHFCKDWHQNNWHLLSIMIFQSLFWQASTFRPSNTPSHWCPWRRTGAIYTLLIQKGRVISFLLSKSLTSCKH